jgi:CRP-like cAMP-binding protein
MLIDQTDLGRGMSWEFTNEVYAVTTTESFAEGDFLFREGDHAKYFYVLLEGRVRLSMGKTGQVVYIVDRPGEAFGWSSLVGREVYSASAECVLASRCFRIDKEAFDKVLESKTADGVTFFRRLADILGERLINIYDTLVLG